MPIGYNTSSQTTPDQLSSLGVNVDDINSQVDQEIANKQANTVTADQFYKISEDIFKSGKMPGKTHEEVYYGLMDYYKRKGKSIEGINIDEDLATYNQQKGNPQESETPQEEVSVNEEMDSKPTSQVGQLIKGSADLGHKLLVGGIANLENTRKSAVAQVPEILGNLAGFGVGIFNDKAGEQIKKWGEEGKTGLQDILGVDKDTLSNTIGETGADILSFFIPGPQVAKLVSSYPKFAKGIELIGSKVEELKKAYPEVYKGIQKIAKNKFTPSKEDIKSVTTGGLQGAKASVISEGEVTPSSVVYGAAANPILDKVTGFVKSLSGRDIVGGLSKVIGGRNKKGQTPQQYNENMNNIATALKDFNKRPDSPAQLYDDLSQIQKDIYDKHINPALKKASQTKEGTIDMKSIVNDVYNNLKSKTIEGKVDLMKSFKKSKESQKVKDIVENLNQDFIKNPTIETAEKVKQYTAALKRESNANTNITTHEKNFINDLDEKLGEAINTKVEKLTGTLTGNLKKQYGSIARNKDALATKIINEQKLTSENLWEGISLRAGLVDIGKGDIKQGIGKIAVGKLLKLIRSPETILKSTMNQIYKKADNPVKEQIKKKIVSGGVGVYGAKADTNIKNTK